MRDDSEPPLPDPSGEPHSGDSILESIGRRTGRAPRTSLHDADSSDPSPIVDPRAGAFEGELRGRNRASAHRSRRRRRRDALAAPEPAAWSESALMDVFSTFEPIAAGG
ncbi:MAG: hypothetical protein AAGB93_21070 [Planctomycetota bacterium]